MKKHFALLLTIITVLFIFTGCSKCPCKSDKNEKPSLTKLMKDGDSVPVKELEGARFITENNIDDVDQFKSFGGAKGTCEFVANELYTSKHGKTLEKGTVFTIGKAYILKNTDGLGNTGTKLLLESAEPRGLYFYCYEFVSSEKTFTALDKDIVIANLAGVFKIDLKSQK